MIYYEYLFVAFGIQHAMRMRPSHLWSVHLYYIFPHYLINGMIFEKKVLLILKVCFDFPYNFC